MRAILSIIVILMLPLAAASEEIRCEQGDPDIDTGETPAGRYYVVNDECQPECLFSVWIYKESNGVDGLQRGDQTMNDDGVYCESDTIIF